MVVEGERVRPGAGCLHFARVSGILLCYPVRHVWHRREEEVLVLEVELEL